MKDVMIIAGEASGDLHGAKLVKNVKGKQADINFYGIGGEHMRAAGVRTYVDSKDMAVVGLVEILAHRKVIFGALNKMREMITTKPPDLLILVDYPEFNLRLAAHAKKHGVKVLFYISPQIWAWRQYRVKKIKRLVDMMAVVFPFEAAFYLKHQVPVEFVGHPLVDEVKPSASKIELQHAFGLDADKTTIGLFPGSRKSEIKRLFAIILQSARLLKQRHPNLQFVLPLSNTLDPADLQPLLSEYSDLAISVIQDRPYDVMHVSDLILTVSGTVTLEIALIGTPLVIINKLATFTYMLVRRLLKIDHIGLCNIVANKRIAPELIQHDATPQRIAQTMSSLLENPQTLQSMHEELATIEKMLGAGGGIGKISDLTLKMLAG